MDVQRIVSMSSLETVLFYIGNHYTLFDFIDKHCFDKWKNRGRCIDVDDYLDTLDYENLVIRAEEDVDSFLTLIELVYNFWYLSNTWFQNENTKLISVGNYYHLQKVMDEVLSQFNHAAYVDEDEEQVIVVEDKREVSSVVEVLEPDLAWDAIRYNHRSLKGDIETKKAILLLFGQELEPKRAEIMKHNKQLADDIFFMLNNMNLRHNNRSQKDKNYKKYVANMKKDGLEKWYDELYQMILLAFLTLDNAERMEKVKELKAKIVGE